ncbi:hypothetical protein D7Z26_10310 [Cohnella endophytica]|uniref:Uncharacterized protein n=1 Tax=Cohnella endophytica TaxID=2419778 RepID=A0A494Y5H2_9BACL|nr:hypothetical protein [Cohnella endophytica]RKP55566.1 hypothetical protein D7Z26_10310 [Cohnella endophytica]
MSWDVSFMKFPNAIKELEDLNEDVIESMGNYNEVASILVEIFPDLDFTDPTWGVLERTDYSIEFNMPEEDNVTSFMLHIRGNQGAIEALRSIHKRTGWKAVEGSEGILNLDLNPEKGLIEWQEYRNAMINQIKTKKKKWYQFWK